MDKNNNIKNIVNDFKSDMSKAIFHLQQLKSKKRKVLSKKKFIYLS